MFHIAHIDVAPLLVRPAVAHAAAWLDREAPGWAHTVNPRTLNLECAYNCVLGQVFALTARRAGTSGYGYGCGRLRATGVLVHAGVFAVNRYLPDWIAAVRQRVAA